MQYNKNRTAWWALCDDGGDVVALCDLGGTGATARVAAWWAYDAYGAVIDGQVVNTSTPVNHVGHKGLMLDRLDAGVADGSTLQEIDRLAPGADVVYYARNRSYSPTLSRWLQSDPNGTAQETMPLAVFHGSNLVASYPILGMQMLYQDGSNYYSYIRSNPLRGGDPLGLFVHLMWEEAVAATETVTLTQMIAVVFEAAAEAASLEVSATGSLIAQTSVGLTSAGLMFAVNNPDLTTWMVQTGSSGRSWGSGGGGFGGNMFQPPDGDRLRELVRQIFEHVKNRTPEEREARLEELGVKTNEQFRKVVERVVSSDNQYVKSDGTRATMRDGKIVIWNSGGEPTTFAKATADLADAYLRNNGFSHIIDVLMNPSNRSLGE